jgi:hypothetical protein
MMSKQIKRIVLVLTVVVLSLTLVTGISEAQGGGGRGNGRGSNGTGQGTPGTYQLGTQAGGRGYGQYQNGPANGWMSNLPPAIPGDLPAEVLDALHAGLQDEYNAYATYQAVIDQFGAVRPFTTIQQAEAQHIEALTFLFERYSLDVPDPAAIDLPTFGSLGDACATGVEAETANFALYDQWIATVQDYPDLVQIFTALRDASEHNHLPAFERCAAW